MSEASIEPLGFYVLVEMIEIEEKSSGGIIVQTEKERKREQNGCDIGYVRAIGNTAFRGFPGCNPDDYNPNHTFNKMTPAQIWGVEIGDKVEYRRYEGKESGVKEFDKFRYIPDTQIIGKVRG